MPLVEEAPRNSSESTLRAPTQDAKPSSMSATTTANGTAAEPAAPAAPPPVSAPKAESTASEPKTDEAAEEGDDEPLETINMETFQQLLDLDEDDSAEFAQEMFEAYRSQSETTFKEMDQALATKNLNKLSSLGHFLKGSSAALGVHKVQESCEKIQHYGLKRDEELGVDLTAEKALDLIDALLKQVKVENAIAEEWLQEWFVENTEADD